MADSEPGGATLRQLLTEHYEDLGRRLTRHLGSADLARETLHELYLRPERPDGASVLKNPLAYIITAAVNLARDRWRTENRRANKVDMAALYDLIDQNPGPDRIAEGRSGIEALSRALDLLTPRQKAVMVAARFEQHPQAEIARRLNISTRLVQIELQRALEFCEDYLAKSRS